MGLVGEGLEEVFHVLAQQRVAGDRLLELLELVSRGKLPVVEEVGDLQEARLLGQLLDGVAAVAEDPLLAVDVAHRAAGLGGIPEPSVEGDQPQLGAKVGDVDGQLAFGPFEHRQRQLPVTVPQHCLGHDVDPLLAQSWAFAAAITRCASWWGTSA